MRTVKIKRVVKRGIMTAAATLLALAVAVVAYSSDAVSVVEQKVTSGVLSLYIKSMEETVPESVRIGPEMLDEEDVTYAGKDYPIVTWLLVDNSASIPSGDRIRTKQMLTDLVAGRAEEETFNLCTYDEDLRVLVEGSGDYAELKSAIDAIEYRNQSAYLIDALGKVLETDSADYTRVVVIGDGIELNDQGLTVAELERSLEGKNLPIYILGCKTSDNGQALNEMFALSRTTGANNWTLSDLEEPLNVITALSNEEIPSKVDIAIPEEIQDGTMRGILLSFTDGTTVSLQVTMPFGELAAPEPEPETEPPQTIKPEPTDTEKYENDRSPNMLTYWLIAGGAVFIVAIGLSIFFILKRKREKERIVPVNEPQSDTYMTESFEMKGDAGERTQILVDNDRRLMLCLTDRSNDMRRIETPLRDHVTIGRDRANQVVLDYDRAVSNRHCEIFASGNTFMIKDLNSSNGTYVDGVKVIDQAEILNGSVIRLGRLEFEVEIR